MKLPGGKYYIGDPCYVLDDSVLDKMFVPYMQFRKDSNIFIDNAPVFEFEKYKYSIASTLVGDGVYFDRADNEYGVDSGTLACIPMELIEKYPKIDKDGNSKIGSFLGDYGHSKTIDNDFEFDYRVYRFGNTDNIYLMIDDVMIFLTDELQTIDFI